MYTKIILTLTSFLHLQKYIQLFYISEKFLQHFLFIVFLWRKTSLLRIFFNCWLKRKCRIEKCVQLKKVFLKYYNYLFTIVVHYILICNCQIELQLQMFYIDTKLLRENIVIFSLILTFRWETLCLPCSRLW